MVHEAAADIGGVRPLVWRGDQLLGRGRAESESGFSLVEVVIAVVVLLTALTAVSNLLSTAITTSASSRLEQVATDLASSQLDSDVASGATTLLGESGYSADATKRIGSVAYAIEQEVSPGAGACAAPQAGSPTELAIQVWVTWAPVVSGSTWWTGPHATSSLVTESTYAPVPASALVAGDGSILVTVSDYAGNGQSLVTVTATNTTTQAGTSATTTSSGCVLFANLAAASWNVSASRSGWIDSGESLNTSATQSVTVTAGSVSTAVVKFAQAATVGAQYSVAPVSGVTGTWNVPSFSSTMPVSLYSSAGAPTPSPYVVVPPASVYPLGTTPSYTAVAGSCGTSSIPDGSSTDGVPVNVVDGGSGTAAFALSPVEVVVVDPNGNVLSGATVTATPSTTAGATDPNCPTSGATVMPTMTLGVTCSNGGSCAASTSDVVSGAPDPDAVLTSLSVHLPRKARHGATARLAKTPVHARLLSTCFLNCSTTTVVTSATNPSVYGQSVTFTATVTSSSGTVNKGTVTFTSGSTTLCSAVSVSSGAAQCTTSTLSVGSNGVVGAYTGRGSFASSTSASFSQTVAKAASSTTVAAQPNPAVTGSPVVFTATVTATAPGAGTPTGIVTFENGSATLGTGTLVAGVATYTASSSQLQPGTDSVTGVYSGDTNFSASTSSPLSEQVISVTAYVLSGLPYGTFKLSATYNSETSGASGVAVVVKVQATGVTVYDNGVQVGGVLTTSSFSPVTVEVHP